MTPIWLGGDRLLVVYRRRYGRRGVAMCLVRFTDTEWNVEFEDMLWDPHSAHERDADKRTAMDEMHAIQCGLPSALRLDENTLLAIHWCKDDDEFGVRWTRLRVSD